MRRGLAVRWQIAILLCLITTINYIDRQALAVAAPVIVEQFALSNTDFGLITSGFLFAYAIGQLIIGPVVDRLGTKRSFRFAVIAWSIAGILHAFGRGFWSFFSLRALLGFTESMNFPAAVKAVRRMVPARGAVDCRRYRHVGPGLGALISPPLLGWLILSFGWQWAFIVPGAAGFLWLLIWQARYDRPETHPDLDDDERRLILADRDAEPTPELTTDEPWYAFVRFLRYREVWGLMLSRFVSDGAFYFFVAWLPLYLAQERGFDMRAIALFAIIPFLAADIGSLFGGWLGARLIKRGMSVNASRKWVIWLGALHHSMRAARGADRLGGRRAGADRHRDVRHPDEGVEPVHGAGGPVPGARCGDDLGPVRRRRQFRRHAVRGSRRMGNRALLIRAGIRGRRGDAYRVGRDRDADDS